MENGNKYIGEWKNSNRDGNGSLYYKNGDIYIGEYKDDQMDG